MAKRIDRDGLGFEGAVVSEFSFLETEYGFERSSAVGGWISYTSPNVEITVSHHPEIWVLLEPKELNRGRPLIVNNMAQPRVAVSLLDVLRMRGLSTRERPPTAMTRGQVQKFVAEAAKSLKEVGASLIVGDLELFNEVIEFRRPRVEAEQLKRKVHQLKRAINYTWKRDDYVTLLQAWDELQALDTDDIEESYKRKAAYAMRHRESARSEYDEFMATLNECRRDDDSGN